MTRPERGFDAEPDVPSKPARGSADPAHDAATPGSRPGRLAVEPEVADTLRLLARGYTFPTAAAELGVSERTVRRRVNAVCDRVGVRTTIEVVVWATRVGIV